MTPQERSEMIRLTTMQARNDWVKWTVTQEKEIASLFEATANNIIKQIERSVSQGVIPNARLVGLLDNVTKELRLLNPKLASKIRSIMKKSIDAGMMSGIKAMDAAQIPAKYKVGIGSSFIDKAGNVHRFDPKVQAYAESTWSTINGAAMDAVIRFRPSGLIFSKNVWDITYQSQKLIRNAIQRAVLQGQSPAKLSRLIRGFLNEPERLYRRVRRGGKLVLSKPASTYHPGVGVYRSAYKNAMRLTRTEIARAYHEGSVRYMKTKKWIDGATWRKGSAAPCLSEVCDDYDGQLYKTNDIPAIPHPHCMCYLEYHYSEKTKEELRNVA